MTDDERLLSIMRSARVLKSPESVLVGDLCEVLLKIDPTVHEGMKAKWHHMVRKPQTLEEPPE
jgi:hypothetical protein